MDNFIEIGSYGLRILDAVFFKISFNDYFKIRLEISCGTAGALKGVQNFLLFLVIEILGVKRSEKSVLEFLIEECILVYFFVGFELHLKVGI